MIVNQVFRKLGDENVNAILKLRVRKGITQEELARYVSVDRTTVTKWETGKSKPRVAVLLKLSVVLDCTVDDLLREEKTKK